MSLFKRGKVWWMSFSYKCIQKRRSCETKDKKIAEKIYHKVMTEVAEGKWFEVDEAKKHTFDDLMGKFISEYAPLVSNGQRRNYTFIIKNLKGFFAGIGLSEITPKLISQYQQKRLTDGVKPATVNREKDVISKAFNLAVKQWEMAKENPCQKVPKFPEHNIIERYLSKDEEERLTKVLGGAPELTDIVVIALQTGMRQGEILNLKWQDVDLQNKTLVILRTKNKKPRTIPMNDTVFTLLQNRNKVRNISGMVFTYKAGKLRKDFEKACQRAGIEDFRFHDLRHTAASRMVQAGVDLYTVAKILGHTSVVTTQRYAHHNTESLREPLKVLDNFKMQVVR